MADAKLSREHALALLHRLATDDVFRRNFESHPAKALAALGVPAETIVNLPAEALAPKPLADKGQYRELHGRVAGETTQSLCMIIPTVQIGQDT